ncbi:MAG: Asp23/Gls24 family envelope stress response protein [Candidatus Bipolaricaulota bacterium]|nr:Asp23/Gls24 family envelope stress response protein [Candidatus Bipolaricaulota bacterium]MDW8030303.1 Asp23/Gls24 family envelope stress response protein [Candidatus Bipolaricaulota bacterium]
MAGLRKITSELGDIYISERAIVQLCAQVISEQKGLRTPRQVRESSGFFGAITQAIKGEGIEVLKENGRLVIKMALFAVYGTRIPEAARKAIQEVKMRVRELAGLEVDEVIIEISGVVRE